MPVKDLVKQFESSSTGPVSPTLSQGSGPHSTPPSPNTSGSTPGDLPPPSPARFIHHPLLQTRPRRPLHASPSSPPRAVQVGSAQEKRPASKIIPAESIELLEKRILDPKEKGDSRRGVDRSSEKLATASPSSTSPQGAVGSPTSPRLESKSRLPTHGIPGVGGSGPFTQVSARSHPLGDLAFEEGSSMMHSASIPPRIPQSNKDSRRGVGHSSKNLATPSPLSTSQQGAAGLPSSFQLEKKSTKSHTLPAFEEGSSTKPSGSIPIRIRQSNEVRTTSRRRHDSHDFTPSPPLSPTSTLVSHNHHHHHSSPHVPIAAKTVFSRDSAPLLLPALDDHLASIPPPEFSSFPSTSGRGKSSGPVMFPPLDRLSATGRTVDDLENNATIVPVWRNKNNIFKGVTNSLIGILGSSAISSYYSVQGLYDSFQLFALLLGTIVPHPGADVSNKWRKVFLGTIPNILALNLSNTLVESFILLVILMGITALLLYYFYVTTDRIARESFPEGLQGKDPSSSWGIMIATFALALLYLPLSTIVVHALLWSDDFWVVPNPYINATTFPPVLPPLGPPSQFRDPLDFCYTTTMRKNEINFAPALIILSATTFIFYTVWFPVRLFKVLRAAVPQVDAFTELGKRRNKVEMDHEYQRLLERDTNPFNFLYKDLRVQWGTYKAFYLFVKLSALLIVAILDPSNCMFRNVNTKVVSIAREVVLVLAMLAFWLVQIFLTPFLEPVDNASEWVSRAGYVAFALLGLAAALNPPANIKSALDGPILYIVYTLNYSLSIYFLFIGMSWVHRLVKRISRRVDFSIDIFSPHLDISKGSRHLRRRIWQETISVLLLTSPDCAIPKSQKMVFSESQETQWPPYLLDFQGTPAERHVENLKILREVGGLAYAKAIALHGGKCSRRIKQVQERIQRHFIGPDSYWKTPSESGIDGGYFGNAWWIPFPPTLVMRYDSGQLVVLEKLTELEEYVYQNEDEAVQEKRRIRLALRALDGLVVSWPYTHTNLIGSRASFSAKGRYTAQTAVEYQSGLFSIVRRGSLAWNGIQLGSGFDVQLTYAPEVRVDGDVIGLDAEFDLTPPLAKFLALNRELVHSRLHRINSTLRDYRRQTRRMARAKASALTYEFLCTIYDGPKDPDHLAKIITRQEKDVRAREAIVGHEDAVKAALERMASASRSQVTVWWYLYWDDLWRRNYDTVSELSTHATDFNPHYPTSIGYRPLPRPALEAFLTQRGLFHKNGSRRDFIHPGFLNKLYFRLNQIVFHNSDKSIAVHLGDGSVEVDLEDLEFSSHPKFSTIGTGGGTDHDDVSIRARPLYRWEAIYEDPLYHGGGGRHKRWLPKLAVWMGVTPFWKYEKTLTSGVSLDVRLEDGKYVRLEHAVGKLLDKED